MLVEMQADTIVLTSETHRETLTLGNLVHESEGIGVVMLEVLGDVVSLRIPLRQRAAKQPGKKSKATEPEMETATARAASEMFSEANAEAQP